MLVRLAFVKHHARYRVPAFLDGVHQHRVVVEACLDRGIERIPRTFGVKALQDVQRLVRLLLAEVRILEEDVEADGRRAACSQVANHVRVDGTVPFVVVAELGERRLVDVDDEDVGVVALGDGNLVAGEVLFFVDAGHGLEEQVVDGVLHGVRAAVRDVEEIVL